MAAKIITPDGVKIEASDSKIRVTGGPELCSLAIGSHLAARMTLGGITYAFEADPKGVTITAKRGCPTWDPELMAAELAVMTGYVLTPIKARP